MREERLRVLLLDDEASLREPLKKFLEDNFHYQVDAVGNGEQALNLVEKAQGRYDVALVDQLLVPGPNGIQVMEEMKGRYPDVECIIFTGWGTEHRQRALEAGAFRYLEKPFDYDELAMLIRTAAQQVRLRAISRDILSERDPAHVLAGIVAAACSLAMADEGAIVLLNSASGKLQLHAEAYAVEQQWLRHFKGQDLSREIILSGKIISIPDICQDARVDTKLIDSGIRSFVGVPIPGEDTNLGVLYVYSRAPNRFAGWGTVAVLQTLAGQAGLALSNAQAFQQVRSHASYMEALVRAGQRLIKETEMEDQLLLTWDFVREQFQVSTFFIALYDRQTEILHFPLAYDLGQQIHIPDRRLSESRTEWGVTGHVCKTGEELCWLTREDGQQQCRTLDIQCALIGNPSESCFYLPLKVGGEAVGVISIQSYEHHAFTPILLDGCRALGTQLAAVLETVRLFQAEAQRRHEAETLREAALALTTTLKPEVVFENILAELQKVVPYDSASVQLLKGDRLEIIGGRGFPNLPELLGDSFPLDGDNPNREVVRRRDYYIVPDAPAVYKEFTHAPHAQAGIRGWLGVPMLVGDLPIGMIALDKRESGFFTKEHARLALAFAAQAAIAIENARLYDETQRRACRQETMQKLALILNSSLRLDEILNAACQAAVEFFNADHSGLMLLDHDLTQGKVSAEYPTLGTLGTIIPIRGAPAEEQLVEAQKPLTISNVADSKSLGQVRDILLGFNIRSILIVPVTGKDGGMLGSFSLDAIGRTRQFTEEEVEVCQVFAAHVATAVENARLYQETQEGKSYIQSLYKASNTLISPQEPGQVLQAIVEQARSAANANWVSVILVDEMGQARSLVTAGTDKQFDITEVIRPNGITKEVMRTGKAEVIDDVNKQQERVNPSMFRDNIAAALCLPLSIQGKRIGVMWIHYNKPRNFPPTEIDALQLYVNQASIAYSSARRMYELEHLRQAAEKLASVATVQDALQQIVKSAREVLEAQSAIIWSYDDIRGVFFPDEMAADGIEPALLERFRNDKPRLGGTAEIVMKQGYIDVIDIDDPQYRFLGSAADGLRGKIGAKAFQGISLRVSEEKVGVLYVNYLRPRRFRDEDKAILETFAHHAALTLKRARLLEQVTRVRDGAQRVAQATTLGDLKTTLESIVKAVREVLRCDIVTLYTFDEGTRHFEQVVGDGYKQWKHIRQPSQITDGSILWSISALKEPYRHYAENATDDPLLRGHFVEKEKVKSALGILLRFEEQRVGIMFVNYRTLHRFSSDELINAQLFANQAAIAIRNTQLFEETTRKAKVLEALYEADNTATSSLAVDEILDSIAEQAYSLTSYYRGPARFSLLALVEGSKLRVVKAYPREYLPGLQKETEAIDLEQDGCIGVIGRTVGTGQSRLVSDVARDADYILYDPETRSELAVPIKAEERIIGIINVEHPERDAFSTSDQHMLEFLAAQAAIAIRHARRNELQQAVYEASKVIATNIYVEQQELLTRILEQAVTRIRWPHRPKAVLGLIQLYDQSSEELRLESVYPPTEFPQVRAHLGDSRVLSEDKVNRRLIGVNGRTVLQGKVQRVLDVRTDPDYVELYPNTLSELDAPLRVNDKVVGVLGLESDRLAAFDELDEQALQSLADLAAVVIETSRRYKELKHAKGLVGARTALAWFGMTSSAWQHAINKHALTIREQTQLLRGDLSKVRPHEQHVRVAERLSMIERLAHQILDKPFTSPLSAEEGAKLVAVNALIGERVRQLWQNDPYKKASLRLDMQLSDDAVVWASPEWLRRAVDILIDNAVDAVANREIREITIGTQPNRGWAEIRVTDTGPGIPKEIQAKIGMELIEKPEDARGLGMGLLMAHTIVETYGGEIRVDSTEPTGTTMVIQLPLAK